MSRLAGAARAAVVESSPVAAPGGVLSGHSASATRSSEFREVVLTAIRDALLPRPPPLVAVWRSAASTNELAKTAASDYEAADFELARVSGSVFLAEEQTAGKGRYGRTWTSPPGGLYLSLLVAPPGASARERVQALPLLPIVAGVAVAEAVRSTACAPATIRWPNDLDLGGGKIAGVLAETGFLRTRPDLAVVGFGINHEPVSLPVAGSGDDPPLRPAGRLPARVDRARLAGALVAAFRELVSLWDRDPAMLRSRWESMSPMARGCRCRVRLHDGAWISGRTDGLDSGGGLRVRTDSGGLRVVCMSEALRVDHRQESAPTASDRRSRE